MRADVAYRRRQAGCDLALHVEIPLLDVVSPGIRFHIRPGERTGVEFVVSTVRFVGRNPQQPSERRSRRIGNNGREVKRRLYALLGVEVSRQRQNVKHREATTNGRLPVALRIPGKTDSRLKIKRGGVRVIRGRPRAALEGCQSSDPYRGKGGIRRPAIG